MEGSKLLKTSSTRANIVKTTEQVAQQAQQTQQATQAIEHSVQQTTKASVLSQEIKLDKKKTKNGSIIQSDVLRYIITGMKKNGDQVYYLARCVVDYRGTYYFIPKSLDNWSATGTIAYDSNFDLIVEQIGYKIQDLSEKTCKENKTVIKCNF